MLPWLASSVAWLRVVLHSDTNLVSGGELNGVRGVHSYTNSEIQIPTRMALKERVGRDLSQQPIRMLLWLRPLARTPTAIVLQHRSKRRHRFGRGRRDSTKIQMAHAQFAILSSYFHIGSFVLNEAGIARVMNLVIGLLFYISNQDLKLMVLFILQVTATRSR